MKTKRPISEQHNPLETVVSIQRHPRPVGVLIWVGLVSIISSLQGQGQVATVNQAMSSATFVNLYWDSSWDQDNPSLPMAVIDQVTDTVVNSSYVRGLSEYGVNALSFAGSFPPDFHCLQRVPTSVTLYNTVSSTTIADFVQCEHDNGPAVLRQSGVVYNIIMPATNLNVFDVGFCNGAVNVAFHYHGLNNNLLSGPPIFTVINADPSCGDLFDNLFHEMVEAVTDPYPLDISVIPPHFNASGLTNEIADFCEGKDITMFLSSVSVQTPSYWSNSKQTCVNFVQRIGVLENGNLFVKEGGLSAGWVWESSNVRSFALTGDRIGVLQNDGNVYVKEGSLTALWTWESSSVQSFALADKRIGVLQNGTLYVKEGALDASWTAESWNVQSFALAGNRIGVLNSSPDHTVFVKEGPLDAPWTAESSNVQSFALEGDRIGVLNASPDHTLYVKEGPLTALWAAESSSVQSFALAGDRIGVLNNTPDHTVWVKEGPLTALWTAESWNVQSFALSGDRIAVLNSSPDHTLFVKQGPLTASWTTENSNVQSFALEGNRIAVLDGANNLSVKEGALGATLVVEAGAVQSFSLSY